MPDRTRGFAAASRSDTGTVVALTPGVLRQLALLEPAAASGLADAAPRLLAGL